MAETSRFREILDILKKHEIIKGLNPVKVRQIVEDLGPTYVKIGQIMSMRTDFLPKEYCEELEKLRSNVPPMPYEEVVRVIERSYNRDLGDVFSSFEKEPLGAASIAQAHAAIIKSGERVVVKVQREGIYDIMHKDVDMLHRAAKFLQYNPALESVDLNQILDEMWNMALEEMDFLIEAANMVDFSEKNIDTVYIHVPRLYREYTTSEVLVMEYIDGYDINDKKTLESNGYSLKEIGEKLADNYMKQILKDGYFHADPHPGNIRIRDGKIVWLDLGMVGKLSDRDRMLIDGIVMGIANKDGNEIKDALIAIGNVKGKIDHHQLYMDIDDIVTKYASQGLKDLNLSSVFADLFDTMGRNKIGMPSNLTMLVRGLATIEGVVADLDPDVDVLEIATAQMKRRFRENFDLKEEVEHNARTVVRSVKKALDMPGTISDLLHMFMKGQTRIDFDVHTSSDFSLLLNSLVRQVVLGLITCSLLISSSLICLTDMKPKILNIPVIGCLGYLLSFVLAIILVIEHIKANKTGK